jgi:hypothetical protein
MATRMQQRRGTALQWTTANPVLEPGEIGWESDTNKFKIGDGVNNWTGLSYFLDVDSLGGSLEDYVPISTVGEPDGVASLDSTGNVPLSQLGNVPLPDLTGYATETYVNTAVSNLIDAAPETLNTLNELAAALNDDANFVTTIQNQIDNITVTSTVVSSNITLSRGKFFINTSAARTLTLPATPVVGTEIELFDASNLAATNNVTIQPNGEKIDGIIEDVIIDVNAFVVGFVYTGSTYGWRMV